MPLSAGTRLGPHEIVAPLGAGGMGEVYRAKDTRLGREVAVKVLPAEVASDPERLRRFEQEAKAVSALNHPHIVTLHEIGQSEHGPYLVLERIEGKSLRELLRDGTLPVKRILALGAQIAEGLAKAHSAGIVHRDLKPENVMVTDDGFAKILDFGLAKLVYPELESGSAAEMTTLVDRTASGMILGTLGYLSPEQAAGRPVDFRADQFALGALLYELATGERPFRRETTPESLAAVIREEPEPIRAKNAALPAQLGWIVDRCLAKDPNDRYASTRDLARDLADLRDHLSEIARGEVSALAGAAAPAPFSRRLPWIVAALAVAAALAAFVLRPRGAAPHPPTYRALTFQRGVVTGAGFSPDGETVYYSAAFGAGPSRVYATRLEGTSSIALDLPPAFLLSVSSKGELAVLLTEGRHAHNNPGTLARVPALGGTPRPLVDDVLDADWAPDGETLAVVRANHALEYPPGKVLVPNGAWFPRISPRGDRLAYASDGISVVDLDGRHLLDHEIAFVFGLEWSPDGREIWLTGDEAFGADRVLYAVSLAGERRLLAGAPGALTIEDVDRERRRALVTTGSGWASIQAGDRDQATEVTLDLFGRTALLGLSSDGRWALLYELREVGRGLYLRSTDGSRTIRLGEDPALGLSPDGAWALTRRRGDADPSHLHLVPTGAGAARQIELGPSLRATIDSRARWSLDGSHLFVSLASATDGPSSARIHVLEKDRWRPLTPAGVSGPFAVSPDGRSVAARDDSGRLTIYPVEGGAPRALASGRGIPVGWSADGAALFLATFDLFSTHVDRLELATGRVEAWRDLAPPDPAGVTTFLEVFVSADGSSYVYSHSWSLQVLYLVEGLE